MGNLVNASEWQVCPLGFNFKRDKGSGLGQIVQIRPTTARVIRMGRLSKATAQSLWSAEAPAPLSRWTVFICSATGSPHTAALRWQNINERPRRLQRACFLIPPSGQCRAGPPLSYSDGRRQDLGVSLSRPPQDPIQGLGDTDQPSEFLQRKYGFPGLQSVPLIFKGAT